MGADQISPGAPCRASAWGDPLDAVADLMEEIGDPAGDAFAAHPLVNLRMAFNHQRRVMRLQESYPAPQHPRVRLPSTSTLIQSTDIPEDARGRPARRASPSGRRGEGL